MILPQIDNHKLRFKVYDQQIKFPFVIYDDFETLSEYRMHFKTKLFQNIVPFKIGTLGVLTNNA